VAHPSASAARFPQSLVCRPRSSSIHRRAPPRIPLPAASRQLPTVRPLAVVHHPYRTWLLAPDCPLLARGPRLRYRPSIPSLAVTARQSCEGQALPRPAPTSPGVLTRRWPLAMVSLHRPSAPVFLTGQGCSDRPRMRALYKATPLLTLCPRLDRCCPPVSSADSPLFPSRCGRRRPPHQPFLFPPEQVEKVFQVLEQHPESPVLPSLHRSAATPAP
jgi:hypothetical protein